MPIMSFKGPDGGYEAIGRALEHLQSRTPRALDDARGGATPSQPIPVYTLGLDDLTDASFLRNARQTGWRYWLWSDGAVAAADVAQSDAQGGVDFSKLVRGKKVESLLRASVGANEAYAAAPGNHEPRVLEIPALHLSVFWLHGPEDHFFPYRAAPLDVDLRPPREDTEFLQHVLAEAQAARRLIDEFNQANDSDTDLGPAVR